MQGSLVCSLWRGNLIDSAQVDWLPFNLPASAVGHHPTVWMWGLLGVLTQYILAVLEKSRMPMILVLHPTAGTDATAVSTVANDSTFFREI